MVSRRYTTWEWCEGIPPGVLKAYTRGFVSRIQLPCGVFIEHATNIFRSQPVIEVVAEDVVAPHGSGQWIHRWVPVNDAEYPRGFQVAFHQLPTFFGSREEAVAASSPLFVAYGRQHAELPELAAVGAA